MKKLLFICILVLNVASLSFLVLSQKEHAVSIKSAVAEMDGDKCTTECSVCGYQCCGEEPGNCTLTNDCKHTH